MQPKNLGDIIKQIRVPVVAKAYELAAFKTFLKTGKNTGGQELPMMSGVARERLSHMSDAEMEALHGFLTSLPNPGE